MHQGSADLNTYKMFLETGHGLLRKGGRLGLLVPSGLYSDKGASSLRQLFLKKSRWSHLYAFQNERFIFGAVHHSFKVAAIQVEKGGTPSSLRTRFRLGPGDSPEPHELETDIPNESSYLSVSVREIEEFSPKSGAILEIRTPRDLDIAKKLYGKGVLLGDKAADCWNIRYTREFDMTNDSELFPPRWKWEDKGYRPDEYGHWLLGNWQSYDGSRSILQRPNGLILSADSAAAVQSNEVEDLALSLYQGGMINQFDYCASAYRRMEGKRGFKWVPIAWDNKQIEPQYLMGRDDFLEAEGTVRPFKMVFRDISASTNARTFLAAFAYEVPCGNSLGALDVNGSVPWTLAAITNSFTFDWVARRRMGGSHLNLFVVEELPSLRPDVVRILDKFSRGLLHPSASFAPLWLTASRDIPWKQCWAITQHERLRLRAILEVAIAMKFGIDETEFREILRDCDRSLEALASSPITRTLDTKGFWRFERDLAPELRLAVVSQVAFREAVNVGLERFLCQNDNEGWMLPETLRLADYGLGHDDRAREPQPVASALGPRFYPWQFEQSAEESWEECERHAEVLAKLLPPPDPEKKRTPKTATSSPSIYSVIPSIPICSALPYIRNPEGAKSPWPECSIRSRTRKTSSKTSSVTS